MKRNLAWKIGTQDYLQYVLKHYHVINSVFILVPLVLLQFFYTSTTSSNRKGIRVSQDYYMVMKILLPKEPYIEPKWHKIWERSNRFRPLFQHTAWTWYCTSGTIQHMMSWENRSMKECSRQIWDSRFIGNGKSVDWKVNFALSIDLEKLYGTMG